jgi:Mn2+/Fe2+ NRAMP family transporter
MPLLPAILATSLDGLLLLLLVPQKAVRSSELFTVGLLAVVVLCFIIDLVVSRPQLTQVGGWIRLGCGRRGSVWIRLGFEMGFGWDLVGTSHTCKHDEAQSELTPPPNKTPKVVSGLVPRLQRDSVATAVSIVGANVMPHSFFLHRWAGSSHAVCVVGV